MSKKILMRVEKHGRCFTKFPLKKAWGGSFGGYDSNATLGHTSYNFDSDCLHKIKICLTSNALELYTKKRQLWMRISLNEINRCEEFNFGQELQLKKSFLTTYPDFNAIYINYLDNRELYILFWSDIFKWQTEIHFQFLNNLLSSLKETEKETKTQKLHERITVENISKPTSAVSYEELISNVSIKRGGEIQGGKYIFKIKVENNTDSNITDLYFQIISYPRDSIKLLGDKFREILKLDSGGMVSPTFEFLPTKDCIIGTIHATVTYIDHLNKPHTLNVEPYEISLICGLLQPKKIDFSDFVNITKNLLDFERIGEEIKIPYNPKLIFEKLKILLPEQNFLTVIEPEDKVLGNIFIGEINGFAEGKFNKKGIGVKITVSGDLNLNSCVGMIEGFAEDQSMLAPLITELSERIIIWECRRCRAPIKKEDVEKLLKHEIIECKYCGYSITKLLS